jgi:ABC-type transporter Mla MlaB component
MLRISQISGRGSMLTLKVEGKLRGPWVSELAKECDALQGSPGCLGLDLSAVTFVDPAGLALLRGLLARGVALAGCSELVVELLHVEGR